MKNKYAGSAKREKPKRRSSRLPWIVALALVGLISLLGGVYAWADQQARSEISGKLTADGLTQDIGTVPFSGGLAKARYALAAQGGPVVVRSITTT